MTDEAEPADISESAVDDGGGGDGEGVVDEEDVEEATAVVAVVRVGRRSLVKAEVEEEGATTTTTTTKEPAVRHFLDDLLEDFTVRHVCQFFNVIVGSFCSELLKTGINHNTI